MSGARSKSSNKKFRTKTTLKSIHTNTSTASSLSEQQDKITVDRMNLPNENSWQMIKHQKQTSPSKDKNSLTVRRLPKILRLASSLTSLTKKDNRQRQQQQTSSTMTLETPVGWEQVLDRGFQSLDIDEDGYVSMADLQSVLKNFSHICNSNEIILRIFAELDLNHDQRISKQEFKLYKNTLLDREKRFHRSTFDEKLGTIFALFDRNHDNYISPHEIRETMSNLGEAIDDDLIAEMMRTADTNRDGRISRDEFKKLLIQLNSQKEM